MSTDTFRSYTRVRTGRQRTEVSRPIFCRFEGGILNWELSSLMPTLRRLLWFVSSVRNQSSRLNVGISEDRKSTRLNSSHVAISYAVFCLKKKKKDQIGCRY